METINLFGASRHAKVIVDTVHAQSDAGATVIPGIRISRWHTISASAAAIKDIPDGTATIGYQYIIIKMIQLIDNQQLNGGG